MAMKLGHMVPASVLRQAPTPTQRRLAAAKRAVVFGVGEVRFGLPGFVVGAEAEIFVWLVGIDELAGVHAVSRDPRCA